MSPRARACVLAAERWRRVGDVGRRIGLQQLPAYILQGATNLSPQVSLEWPGSESSTVQSREDGKGGEEGRKKGGKALH